MDIFRVAQTNDAAAIVALTGGATAGLTNVPKTLEEVEAYISDTHQFLAGDAGANRALFVVERDGRIVGISGVVPELGVDRPFYNFKRSRHARRSIEPQLKARYDTLQLVTDFDGYSELASLFLAPDARGGGLGRLLSFGRLAFMFRHADRFAPRFMADIRGWTDADGVSPFWTHLTSKFVDCAFDEADRLSAIDGQFISDLLPALPILMNLMPPIVDACTGKPHDLSAGALKMLKSAGFRATDLCDVFDGGPAVECEAQDTAIAASARRLDRDAAAALDKNARLLAYSGTGASFRATLMSADNALQAHEAVSQAGEVWASNMAVETMELVQ